jgi:hypothetical protein
MADMKTLNGLMERREAERKAYDEKLSGKQTPPQKKSQF